MRFNVGTGARQGSVECARLAVAARELPPGLHADPGHVSEGHRGGAVRLDATQAERQAAVDSVAGRVVGGRPFRGGDGYYFLRVPGNGDPRVLFEAIRVLNALPQVLSATPEYVDIGLRN